MTKVWVTMEWVLGPPPVGVSELTVQLLRHARRDQQRQHTVRALPEHMCGSGAVETKGVRDDSASLSVQITPYTRQKRCER